MIYISLLALAMPAMLLAQKFEAKVSRSTLTEDERFRLTFEIQGNGKRFTPPDFSDFHVLAGPSQQVNRQFINGKFFSSLSFSYILKPKQTGEFTIGSAQIISEGKTISTEPVSIKVVAGRNSASNNQQNSEGSSLEDQISANLFMKCFVNKKEAFVGEQITATYKLYINVQIVDHTIKELPVFNGFYVQDVEIPQGAEMSQEIINGKRFQVATIKRVILFPQQSGELEVPPFNMSLKVRVNEKRRPRTLLEQFMGTHRDVNVNVNSNPEIIQVSALPREGQPIDFKGAVGKYSLKAEVDKNKVSVNDAINLNVTISGKGNLELITDPGIEFPNDFETYDPKVRDNIDVTASGVSGSKTFEYVLIPRYAGKFNIEDLSLSYFNPETKRYERSSVDPIEFEVSKGSGDPSQNPSYVSPRKEDVKMLGKDIRFIKTGDPELISEQSTFFGSPAFIGLSAAPVAGMGLAVLLFSFFRVRNSDVVGLKMRNAKSLAKRKLAAARKAADKDQDTFYDEVYKAIYGYLGDRFNIPVSELNKDQIKENLEAKSVNAVTIEKLIKCIDDCEMARFAPGAVRSKSEVLEIAEQAISEIEHEID